MPISSFLSAALLAATLPAERVGVCSWSWQLPMREVVAQMETNGIRGVNLALMPFIENDKYHGGSETPETWAWLKEKVRRGDITVMSTMISTVGEDYTTIDSIRRTGGIVPDSHWEANKVRFEKGAALTAELGCRYLLTHAGFMDESDPRAFSNYLARVRWIRDACAKQGVTLILETGQESSAALARFLPMVPGVYVNYDPANMLQYGTDTAIAGLRRLYPWIRQIHIKDARVQQVPGQWSEEVPWGEGAVDSEAFMDELERLGFTGNCVIEREDGNSRAEDIFLARDRLVGVQPRGRFAGRDPRFPDFAEDNFKLPFRAMFIGAHPDDADYQFGATATKLVRAGARVAFVSVCSGDRGHQTMAPDDLAARRYKETQAAARVYGLEKYVVIGEHDCLVEPTVRLRTRITELIRTFAPNMVVTHRTCDYHADHRATGQVVQDATYLLAVPHFCPAVPVPETLPFVMYAGDVFTVPRPIRADLLVQGDDVIETTLRALACHESQLFEWLPSEYGIDWKKIPTGAAERLDFLRQHVPADLYLNANLHRPLVDRMFGGSAAYVDAFELCEYARKPAVKEIAYLESLGFKWAKKYVK